jgi:hypothetical protein
VQHRCKILFRRAGRIVLMEVTSDDLRMFEAFQGVSRKTVVEDVDSFHTNRCRALALLREPFRFRVHDRRVELEHVMLSLSEGEIGEQVTLKKPERLVSIHTTPSVSRYLLGIEGA